MCNQYQIRLEDIRIASDGKDDVALFDIVRGTDEETWRVRVYLSPLFRFLNMRPHSPPEVREQMVGGLGARVIANRLQRGIEPPFEEQLVVAAHYPGAPGKPDVLHPYDHVTVRVGEV